MSINETVTLRNNVEMPRFGLGVWQVEDGAEVTFDTEEGVKGIQACNVVQV